MATLVLTAVGSALGGKLGGALGAILGQRIDQEIFAPKGRRGPRLGDLTVQTSSYGNALPKIFGTMRAAGTVIWATDLREERNRSGRGKGQPKTTTYSYSASFAVALSARPIRAVRRIWADGNLLRGAAGDFKSETGFRLHLGHENQAVDPLIAAVEGMGQAPAYRGCAYAVFEDFQLADYGNRIPSLTFEIEADAGPVTLDAIAGALSGGAVSGGALALGGYAAAGDSVRGAIEALAAAAGLSVRDDGDALHLTAAGAADLILPHAAWLPDDESERVAALAIPDAVALAYYEPARDFQAGLQRATRGGAGRKTERIELPVAIGPGAAKGLAEAKLARDWMGRERRRIGLCWRWMDVRPGAVLRLEGEAGDWRVAQWALEGMAVQLVLVRVGGGAIEVPDAEPGRGVGGTDVLHGPTILHVLDLPDLGETPVTSPRLLVAAAGASAGWRRAMLSLSLDDGASWSAIGGTAPAAVIGAAASVLAPGSAWLFDDGAVEVVLAHEEMALAEADDARLIAGTNLALLGDELIQFGRATPLGDGHYRLSRLLRGRRGTEAAMADHAAGERFVLIEAEALLPVDLPLSALGGPARVMAAGLGDGQQVAAVGAAVRPPAPVHLKIVARADGGFAIGWIRRSRAGWRWSDGVDAPLVEEREAYVLRIVTGSGTIRIVETLTSAFHYTAAMVAEDGGAGAAITVSVTQIGALALSLPATARFSTL